MKKTLHCPYELNVTEKALMQVHMLESGIVPITDIDQDVSKTLTNDDSSRKMKRKFRKMWRKLSASREVENARGWKVTRESAYGKGSQRPSARMKKERKRLVMDYFYGVKVNPTLETFVNNPSKEDDND